MMSGKDHIRIEIALIGHGYMEATLTHDEDVISAEASYLSDAPSDLIHTVRSLLEGRNEAMCRWQDEPGEFRWLFHREDDRLFIALLWFEENFSKKRDEDGEVLFADEDDLHCFAGRVLSAFHALSMNCSPADYEAQWGYPFPQRALRRLQEALHQG